MKWPNKIWKNKLEDYVKDLYFEQRKTSEEIAKIIKKDRGISIRREAIRNFLNSEISAR